MKCIRNLSTLEIRRVPNEIAEIQVKSGNYSYIPKKEWKAQRIPVATVVIIPSDEQKMEISRRADKKKHQKEKKAYKRSYMSNK